MLRIACRLPAGGTGAERRIGTARGGRVHGEIQDRVRVATGLVAADARPRPRGVGCRGAGVLAG
ncbi:MAG: hypothetical protein CSB46_09595, partial [Micrococcales bacterium]